MGQIVHLEETHDRMLKDLLRTCEEATIYHTPGWRDTIVSTYGYEPIYLGYQEGDRLTALLPLMLVNSWLTGRRLVSLPFSNTCGPIGCRDHLGLLLDEALRLHRERRLKALEIRTQANLNPLCDQRFASVNYFVTSIVPLDEDPIRVWKRFKDKNVRTEVRQAAKKGVEVTECSDGEDLKRFYSLFVGSRLRYGVPPQPFGFFRNLWQHLWPDNMDLFLAKYRDRCVGGLITLGSGNTICAAYIGSDMAYRTCRVHQALLWKAMEAACFRGYRYFDFLRTPKKSESHRYFKQRWNAAEIDLHYMYYPEVLGTASTVEETVRYNLMTNVLKRSPFFVGRLVGRVLYKHLG